MKNINPLKSNNIVARILQVYAYVNAAAGFILTLLINKELELDAVVLSIILASVLVVNFLIFALGEIIDLLQLEKARADLGGLFKSKERDAITERLNTIERPKLDRLSQECEIAKQKNKSCIDAEIAALNRPELRYEKENLKKRQAEIKRELTRDRL